MGHFGKRPIRLAWFGVVCPALLLNYFGQGAMLLAQSRSASTTRSIGFSRAGPLYPLIVLATARRVIASQAADLRRLLDDAAGDAARLPAAHDASSTRRRSEIGQIYVPVINWTLFAARDRRGRVGFGSSTALGAAYGIAVTGDDADHDVPDFLRRPVRMALQLAALRIRDGVLFHYRRDVLFCESAEDCRGWLVPARDRCGGVHPHGDVGPRLGNEAAEARVRAGKTPLKPYLTSLLDRSPVRVGGTAIFLTPHPDAVPHALVNNLLHNRVLHERVVFLTVVTKEVPWVPDSERLMVEPLCPGCYQVTISYGFKDEVDLPQTLVMCKPAGFAFEPLETSWFLSRAALVPKPGHEMALWRERLFAVMLHNVGNVAAFFKLPANRVIEVGARVEI